MFAIGNQELDALPPLDTTTTCHRCGETHPVIDSDPPGRLQTVRCGDGTFLIGINWRKLPPPKTKP